jgi:hypothetical protein
MTAFWDISACSLVEADLLFRVAYCLHHHEFFALMIDAARVCEKSVMIKAVHTSETSVYLETTRRCIPEGCHLHLNVILRGFPSKFRIVCRFLRIFTLFFPLKNATAQNPEEHRGHLRRCVNLTHIVILCVLPSRDLVSHSYKTTARTLQRFDCMNHNRSRETVTSASSWFPPFASLSTPGL